MTQELSADVGIWQGIDVAGHETNELILVNNGEAAVWSKADQLLRKHETPIAGGLVLDIGSGSKNSSRLFTRRHLIFSFKVDDEKRQLPP